MPVARLSPADLVATPSSDPVDRDWSMDPDAVAILLYTSGTTGAPKAAIVRHRHLVSYVLGTIEFASAGPDECALVAMPPYHIAGMTALCTSVYAGRRMVQLANFDPDDWIDLARAEGVTHAMVVPTMLSRIVDRLAARDDGGIPTLRVVAYGGGRMPAPVVERALELLPDTDFSNAYGLTETSSTVAVLGPEEHRSGEHLGSVGRPLPTLEVSVRDDEGREVPAGTDGEVWVRGDQVSGEYVGLAPRVDADGWFHTNDSGRLDADGYLYIEGRLDDVIVRGGENISPGEIEDVVVRHSGVAEAAAVGVPDDEWGEAIGLVVVPAPGADAPTLDELSAHVVGELRSSRRPDHLLVRDELPYNETGKLLRRVLRAEFQ